MPENGFTLLEIIIALFIFTILASIATLGLHTAITSHDRINVHSKQLKRLQVAMTLLERDITQTIDRPVTSNAGRKLPAFTGSNLTHTIEFTHGGQINPLAMEPRSTLQRTAYTP